MVANDVERHDGRGRDEIGLTLLTHTVRCARMSGALEHIIQTVKNKRRSKDPPVKQRSRSATERVRMRCLGEMSDSEAQRSSSERVQR